MYRAALPTAPVPRVTRLMGIGFGVRGAARTATPMSWPRAGLLLLYAGSKAPLATVSRSRAVMFRSSPPGNTRYRAPWVSKMQCAAVSRTWGETRVAVHLDREVPWMARNSIIAGSPLSSVPATIGLSMGWTAGPGGTQPIVARSAAEEAQVLRIPAYYKWPWNPGPFRPLTPVGRRRGNS